VDGDVLDPLGHAIDELARASVTLLCAGVLKSPTPSCRRPAGLLLMLSAD